MQATGNARVRQPPNAPRKRTVAKTLSLGLVLVVLLVGMLASTHAVAAASAPGAPTGLTVVDNETITTISLTWTNATGGGLTGSFVYYGNASCGDLTTITVGSVVTKYTVTGLLSDKEYGFQVADKNATGTGTKSTCVDGTTANVLTAPPPLATVDLTTIIAIFAGVGASGAALAYVYDRRSGRRQGRHQP